ncbi:aminoacetone oxidase family FAD-binding enzyme [Microbulbifer sp. A4B17]|uniref:NAD(P)/FAD-dependent oxidoreductase n=1 Tax=Microbulbifer sp. A4B17 TaxID=359370 RepID=UPI000D52C7B9|nr:NAD(P)/FAD-dependent oxidoreductase [Microbulbifer sp. A4B17]AWF82350.1 aminoacetone oxidase family FAD-binding enzyme [Microbulbifer sp. A4B17]
MLEVSNSQLPDSVDVLVIGAGAAGLMCAATAGQRGRSVLVLDHANKVGKKILMSGGGRCNFTNLYTSAENFYSNNPHFCKSALARYSQWDFIALIEKHGIAYHEKTLGQLFCDNKSRDIVDLLLAECRVAKAQVRTRCSIAQVKALGQGYRVETNMGAVTCESLVVATGGLSIPTMGASGYGYEVARQFGLDIVPTRAALVPFTQNKRQLERQNTLPGTSLSVTASCAEGSFHEQMLFTHRGLSGPAVLQISSHWREGQTVKFDLAPEENLAEWLQLRRQQSPDSHLHSVLAEIWSKKLVQFFLQRAQISSRPLKQFGEIELRQAGDKLQHWKLTPAGTEGYRTAEVTLGGVDTAQVSSRTMECKTQRGLYFVGEVLDVTGWLGGFNFQWAWASGHAAGEVA